MKGLFKFQVDCGRMGWIKSVFIADVDEVQQSIGKEVCFSEPFGRHTEAQFLLANEMFTLVTTDEKDVALIESLDILPSGHYSPLENIVE